MLNITLNTFKEIVRNKLLYLILFFAFIFIFFSVSLGKLTIGDDSKIIVDFGLAMIEIFGLVGVLFVGSQLLFKEVEGKTIFLILSKPIKRREFIIGKFLGFSLTILLIILFQGILFYTVIFFINSGIFSSWFEYNYSQISADYLLFFSIVFIFFKLEILLALVFFFSTFMSNILTIIISLMIYFISHSFTIIIDLAVRGGDSLVGDLVKGLALFFPPFEALNIKDVIGSFTDFSPMYILGNTLYSFGYLMLILFLTVIIFNRKKFEN